MKKTLFTSLFQLLFSVVLIAQSSTNNNTGFVGNYLGWDSFSSQPLDIVQESTNPIYFYTSGGNASGTGVWNNMRMRIFEDNILAPRGTSYNVGRVGVMESSNRWDISPLPASLLHLGHGWPIGVGGHRTWMDVGTFTCVGSDMMYVGLKQQSRGTEQAPWNDRMDAIINWGDNEALPDNYNDLRFVFTTPTGITSTDEATIEGLEVARMCWNGNMGVGSFRDPANQLLPNRPARRLEVLDRGSNNTAVPQLRLTYEPDNDQFGGTAARWTDFESTINGDLYIHPTRRGADRFVGINVEFPRNTLEINSNAPNASGTGSSGLNFTDLNSTSTGYGFNASGKVLTVNSSGDVILVDDNTSSTGGITFCPSTTTSNYLMKYLSATTACRSGVWEDPITSNIGIGSNSPNAQLVVQNTNASNSVLRINNTSSSNLMKIEDNSAFTFNSTISNGSVGAFYFLDAPTGTNATTNGIVSQAISPSTALGWCNTNAGYFWSHQASSNNCTTIGVTGYATANTTSSSSSIWGVYGRATAQNGNQVVVGGNFLADGNGTWNVGLNGAATGTTGNNVGVQAALQSVANTNYGIYGSAKYATTNYGVWAIATGGTNNYGIYAAAPTGTATTINTAAFFNGDIFGTTGNFSTSDIKFKQNIQPLSNASNLISQLTPKIYQFNQTAYPSFNFANGNQYGLIAQDVEQVIPEMVKSFKNPAVKDSLGNVIYPEVDFKALNYETLIPILVAAFQEQKNALDSVKNVLSGYIGQPRSQSQNTSQKITLSDAQAILLRQNDPNPFAESTVIRFSIPENIHNAKLIFTNASGAILKTAVIESRGEGNLEVYASDLSSGIYTYTLVCDGKIIDSKKMMKD